MSADQNRQSREAISRQLETDLRLGIKYVPVKVKPQASPGNSGLQPKAGVPANRPGRASPTASGASPAAVGPVTANKSRVLRLDLSPTDYAARQEQIRLLAKRADACRECPLGSTRTKVVPGQGDVRTRLVFVGEAPGADEDRQGLAFVGRAGQLLTKMIEAMGLSRDWVYICNILKCRPPDNRTPAPSEIKACWPFLDEQLRIIKPEVIVALGKPASQTLLRTDEGIGALRGVWKEYYPSGTPGVGEPIALMPTYHPAYLLRNPPEKGKAWTDLKQVMARLQLDAPGA